MEALRRTRLEGELTAQQRLVEERLAKERKEKVWQADKLVT